MQLDVRKKLGKGTLFEFNHKKGDYMRWRTSFIAAVHDLIVPISQKVISLESALGEDPATDAMFKRLDRSARAYKVIVQYLEDTYGGTKRQLECARRD